MKIRNFQEIYNDLISIDFDPVKENVITGEEYEDWIKSKFISLVDKNNEKENINERRIIRSYKNNR